MFCPRPAARLVFWKSGGNIPRQAWEKCLQTNRAKRATLKFVETDLQLDLSAMKPSLGPRKKRLARPAVWGPVPGLAVAFWLAMALTLLAQPYPRNVLVMASYEPGSRLEEEQIEGLRAALPPDVELIIDYLDAKRMAPRNDYMQLYMGVMWSKYKNRRLNAIVALNDDAIRFVNCYRTNIFARPPLILCGSSTNIVGELSNLTNWTGAFSEPNMEKTIQLSLALHPKAREIHVITDRTTPGQQAREQIKQAADAARFSVPVVLTDEERPWSFRQMLEHVRQIKPEAVVFFAEFFLDNGGAVFLVHRLMPYLSDESKAPIYTMQREAVGVGAVGGHVIDGERMGRTVGEMVLRVLGGESPSFIPPVVLEGEWLFDDVQLKRWGIDERNLPKGSRIIGRPVSFFEKNKQILWVGGLIVAVELAIIAMLLVNRAGRIRAQRALQASETRYRSLFEVSEDLFMIMDQHGAILHANPATCRLLGYSLDDLIGKEQTDLVAPAESARVRAQLNLALAGGRAVLESCCVTREGVEMPVEFLFQPFDCEGGPAAVCFARNLSERIKIQRLTQEISEKERQAMGHDIHDGLGQYLTALRFQCHRLEQVAADHRLLEAGEIAKLNQITSELAFEVRSLARSLVPLQMISRSLKSALQELMEINTRHFHIQATLDFSVDEGPFLPDVAAQLYRIVQEAMRNAVRHAGATQVRAVLRATDEAGEGELIVENDGQPFKLMPGRRVGMGLAIMEQRARLIGAKLEIRPTEEGWTRLICRFSLHPGRTSGET
jgi:PAS domain S-box-containing protein